MAAPFQNILVLIDAGESSLKAAEYAVHLAAATPARLTALSVVDTDTLNTLLAARILVEQEMREFEADLERSHNRGLKYVRQIAAKAGIQLETVLAKGTCHSTVLAEQKARQIDLIVIGAFRYSLARLDLIARERHLIIDGAPCPVLIIK